MAKEEKEKLDDEPELVKLEVEAPEGETIDQPKAKPAKKPEADDGDDTDDLNDGDESDEGNDRLANREGGERESHQSRKARQREAIRRDKIELNYLRQQNDQLERRVANVENRATSTHLDTVDSRISYVQQQIAQADEVISGAIKAGNGDDAVKAQAIRDDLRDGLAQLKNYKERTTASARQQQPDPRRQQAPAVDAAIINGAREFVSKHDWYDPNAMDEDSAIVLAIDTTMTREGWDPKDPKYWGELERRAAKRLPHRFEAEDGERPAPRRSNGGPRMPAGSNGRGNGGEGGKFKVSAARVEAMKQAGVWDDPKLRDRYVRKYMEYDREHAGDNA